MLNWYKKLYVGDNAKEKRKQYIRKINLGIGVIDIYLVTLAVNPENQLEIFSANQLKQKAFRRRCPMIIGLCKGYGEAMELVVKLVGQTYRETGTAKVRMWLEEKIREEKTLSNQNYCQ